MREAGVSNPEPFLIDELGYCKIKLGADTYFALVVGVAVNMESFRSHWPWSPGATVENRLKNCSDLLPALGFEIDLKLYQQNQVAIDIFPSGSRSPILKGLLSMAALKAMRDTDLSLLKIMDAALCQVQELMALDTYESVSDRLEALGLGTNVLFDRPLHAAASKVPLRARMAGISASRLPASTVSIRSSAAGARRMPQTMLIVPSYSHIS